MKSNTINRLTAGNLVLGCLRHGPGRQLVHLSLLGDITSNSYATDLLGELRYPVGAPSREKDFETILG